jgi:hypothetical protein
MEKFYTTSKSIGKETLESKPEFDLGFDYNGQHIEIGDDPFYKSEAGPVSISDLIEKLQVFQNNGANYVCCDWHCDHVELDIYAFKMSVSTPEEIESYLDVLKKTKQTAKQNEIANLEKKLILLKKDLEVNK